MAEQVDIQFFNPHGLGSDRRQQAKLVANYLRQIAPNDEISYSDIKQAFGFDPQKPLGRYIMGTARKELRKEGIVFDTLITRGWKRLDDRTVSQVFQKTLSSVHSRVKLGLENSSNVDFSKLSQSETIDFASNRACLSMVALYSSQKAYLDARSVVQKKVLGSNNYQGDLTLEAITKIVQPELNPRRKQSNISVNHKWM